jgi:flagellar basal body P-ring formation protein FlgA
MNKFAGLIAASILANTSATAEELVSSRIIRAGSILSATDIVAPNNHEALRRAVDIIGMETTRTLYKGQTINTTTLRTPTLIKRNAIVKMEYIKGPMTISSEGRALDKGGLGDRVRVINLTSKRIVTVIVTGADSVKAQL